MYWGWYSQPHCDIYNRQPIQYVLPCSPHTVLPSIVLRINCENDTEPSTYSARKIGPVILIMLGFLCIRCPSNNCKNAARDESGDTNPV